MNRLDINKHNQKLLADKFIFVDTIMDSVLAMLAGYKVRHVSMGKECHFYMDEEGNILDQSGVPQPHFLSTYPRLYWEKYRGHSSKSYHNQER